MQWCGQRKWSGAERILAFDTSRLPDWVGSDGWFRDLLASLVRKSREKPLMFTVGGCWIKPSTAWLPHTRNPRNRERLWNQMRAWKGAEAKLPTREVTTAWSCNLVAWAELLDERVEAMDEALTWRTWRSLWKTQKPWKGCSGASSTETHSAGWFGFSKLPEMTAR